VLWPLSSKERREIEQLFDTEPIRKLVTGLHQRASDDPISVADAAYWVKGCSSLGRLRYAVLVKVGKKKKGTQGFCLIDIKEAALAQAPKTPGKAMPRDHAERIVLGACNLSPFLGERMVPSRLCDRPVIIRELRPQDLKIELSKISQEEAIEAAHFLGEIIGKAHGRQMTVAQRKQWIFVLKRNQHKRINTPPWLWTSVVDLMSVHERAYLDHCKEHACEAERRHKSTGAN
jgi:uncharacterized protein (DUF2252 family)